MSKKRKTRIVQLQGVDLADIPPSPIRHKRGLSPLLTALARELYRRAGHFTVRSFEQWELGFMRDMHPWWEVVKWEAICRAHARFVAEHPERTDHTYIVGLLGGIALDVSWKDDPRDWGELQRLYWEARDQRWIPIVNTPIEWPRDHYFGLLYRGIVDEHDGLVDPTLDGDLDPRQAIAEAELILGCDHGHADNPFIIYGREFLKKENGKLSPGKRILIVSMDAQNTETCELEKTLAVVSAIKGRHEFPWVVDDAGPTNTGDNV
jgi:hypothetical protein